MLLSQLKNGEKCTIESISPDCKMQRRILDIGFTPGAYAEFVAVSPLGDPTAYLIRGAVIALRREDAENITVKKIN